jgi:HlyD family secretion protein
MKGLKITSSGRRGLPLHTGFALLVLAVLASAVLAGCGNSKSTPVYEFTSITRGTLEKTVSSTGTLNPVATVKVLPRMSGKVEKVYVDYNTPVTKGQILAELNTDSLRLKREQQLAQVTKARANYELQQLNFQNQQRLAERNLISDYELRTTRTNLDGQGADLAIAESNLRSIELEINQYAFITSPIDGIVLDKNLSEGDTVVDSSSSNSTAIFTLAENLEEMQIESWVGELDIASIQPGQEVRFTLDSLPGRTYRGMVESKRLMPSVQDNVVSYKVIISVNNRDGSLLPGMTCSLDFIEERSENILVVSNAALRYQPTYLSATEIAEIVFNAGLRGMDETQRAEAIQVRNDAQNNAASSNANRNAQGGLAGLLNPAGGRGGGGGILRPQPGAQQGARQVSTRTENLGPPRPLWFIDSNGKADVILVQAGISDGSRTEIHPRPGDESPEGKEVVLRERVR